MNLSLTAALQSILHHYLTEQNLFTSRKLVYERSHRTKVRNYMMMNLLPYAFNKCLCISKEELKSCITRLNVVHQDCG